MSRIHDQFLEWECRDVRPEYSDEDLLLLQDNLKQSIFTREYHSDAAAARELIILLQKASRHIEDQDKMEMLSFTDPENEEVIYHICWFGVAAQLFAADQSKVPMYVADSYGILVCEIARWRLVIGK